MTGFRYFFVMACAACPLGAWAADNTLDAVFAKVDKASATFKGLTAEMKRVHHTELVDANEIDEGTITVKKAKPGDIRILIKFTKPDEKLVSLGAGKAI